MEDETKNKGLGYQIVGVLAIAVILIWGVVAQNNRCIEDGCSEKRIEGSKYCEEHDPESIKERKTYKTYGNSYYSYTTKRTTTTPTTTRKKTSSSTTKKTTKYNDPYNAKDYYDAEEFYEEYYDDFDGFDDAEAYYDEYAD